MIIKNHACTYLREIKKISGCSGRPYIDGEIWGPYLRPPRVESGLAAERVKSQMRGAGFKTSNGA